MAQRLTYTDDLDGAPLDADGATIDFSIDGARYEIDLTGEHVEELRAVFARYTAAGRRVRRPIDLASTAAEGAERWRSLIG